MKSLKTKEPANGIDAIRTRASAMAGKLIFGIMAILLLINLVGCSNSDPSSLDVLYLNDSEKKNLAIVYYFNDTDEGLVFFKNNTSGKYDKSVFTFSDKTQAIMSFTPDGKKLSSLETMGYVYTYSNYTDSTVDISVKRPDGTTDTDKGVPLNKSDFKTAFLKPIRELLGFAEISKAFAEDSEKDEFRDSIGVKIPKTLCGDKTCDDRLKEKLESIVADLRKLPGIKQIREFMYGIENKDQWSEDVENSPSDAATLALGTLKAKAGYKSDSKCTPGDQGLTEEGCKLPNGKGVKVDLCDANGNWGFYCQLERCDSGYVQQPGTTPRQGLCVKQEDACSSTYDGTKLGPPCEAPGASKANKVYVCKNSLWQDSGECRIDSCKDGYIMTVVDTAEYRGIVCNEDKCTPDQNQQLEGRCYISHGEGKEVRVCDQSGKWSKPVCTLTSCEVGYKASENSCVKDECTPDKEEKQACSGANGAGEKIRVCDQSGKWGNFGDCIPTSCVPDQPSEASCSIANGEGKKYRHCKSDGTWGEYGMCLLVSCNPGYVMDVGSCVQETPKECTPNQEEKQACSVKNSAGEQIGTGEQVKVCDQSGKWGTPVCTPKSCNTGYTLSDKVCVQQKYTDCIGRPESFKAWDEGCYNSNREREGEWKHYSDETLASVETYVKGILNGPSKSFYTPSGVLQSQGNYKDGKEEGVWEFYDSDGLLTKRDNYKNGKFDGVVEDYYLGVLKSTSTYKDHKLNGPYSSVYPECHVCERGNYVNDVKEGAWENYYDVGKLWERVNYVNGKADGIWETYNEEGKMTSTCTYSKGVYMGCSDVK